MVRHLRLVTLLALVGGVAFASRSAVQGQPAASVPVALITMYLLSIVGQVCVTPA